jgi:cytochrome c553
MHKLSPPRRHGQRHPVHRRLAGRPVHRRQTSYRDGTRTNPVMVSVANSLSDKQLDALAAFFATLSKPERKAPSPATGKNKR